MDNLYKAGTYSIDKSGNIKMLIKVKIFDTKNKNFISKPCKSKRDITHQVWWDQECDDVICIRRQSFENLKKNPTRDTLRQYRMASSDTRKIIAKRKELALEIL